MVDWWDEPEEEVAPVARPEPAEPELVSEPGQQLTHRRVGRSLRTACEQLAGPRNPLLWAIAPEKPTCPACLQAEPVELDPQWSIVVGRSVDPGTLGPGAGDPGKFDHDGRVAPFGREVEEADLSTYEITRGRDSGQDVQGGIPDEETDGEAVLSRTVKEPEPQAALFDLPPDWRKEWWGMPDFSMGDATSEHRITVNFASWDDVEEFKRKLGLKLTRRTDSCWFPPEDIERPGDWRYVGGGRPPRYPIYIPTKGRAEVAITPGQLDKLGVPYRLVVEPPELEAYARRYPMKSILVLPFHDLGEGSIPARNWIWEHAIEEGHARHWIIDDNVTRFYRMNVNRRIPVGDGTMFRAIEDFTDRYDNVAFSGPNDLGFAPDREPNTPAFYLNTRIYSMTLINSALPYRWRGRLNEDTDICLRALKDGWTTILFNTFLGNKAETMKMVGGNTDSVYATDDHRREFAESLKRQHPDVVEVVWKFGRWHHQVDYSGFKRNRLRLRDDVTPTAEPDNFGMKLRKV